MRIRYMLALSCRNPQGFCRGWGVFLVASSRGRQISEGVTPVCRSNRVRPSWPKLIDKILSYSAIKPFRCETCRKRFYGINA